jgi:hypothetical protein
VTTATGFTSSPATPAEADRQPQPRVISLLAPADSPVDRPGSPGSVINYPLQGGISSHPAPLLPRSLWLGLLQSFVYRRDAQQYAMVYLVLA